MLWIFTWKNPYNRNKPTIVISNNRFHNFVMILLCGSGRVNGLRMRSTDFQEDFKTISGDFRSVLRGFRGISYGLRCTNWFQDKCFMRVVGIPGTGAHLYPQQPLPSTTIFMKLSIRPPKASLKPTETSLETITSFIIP